MDALEICNKLRSEASGVATSGIPLDIFPQKMQQMILDLARTENYSIEFTVTSLISAMAAAVGNSCYIRIKGNWITSPILYYCCPLKLFIQNKLGLTLLTKYQPF